MCICTVYVHLAGFKNFHHQMACFEMKLILVRTILIPEQAIKTNHGMNIEKPVMFSFWNILACANIDYPGMESTFLGISWNAQDWEYSSMECF